MKLSFQQRLTLKDGSIILYHEGKLQSGDNFHVLIHVPGKNIEAYFNFIGTQADFAVLKLKAYGQILHCDTGSMHDEEIEIFIKDIIT